jgi:hypothetical protein
MNTEVEEILRERLARYGEGERGFLNEDGKPWPGFVILQEGGGNFLSENGGTDLYRQGRLIRATKL